MRMTRHIALREHSSNCRSGFAHFLAAAYLILSGTLWVFALHTNEGGALSPVALWAELHASLIPVLAVFATLRTFAVERAQGTLDSLLVSSATPDAIVAGKYLASLALTLGTLALSALGPLAILPNVVSSPGAETSAAALLLGCAALFLQAALWTALGTLLSALLRSQSLVATAALLLAGALPYALRFFGAELMFPLARPRIVALDAAHGVFSLYPAVCCAAPVPALLFMA
ncbi:MAG: ABC transporter permease subunit, partial [Kiritimatiellaeota bacterium]|nr:ABC transporter permease subunit [Kiritimatiellota bacterium]